MSHDEPKILHLGDLLKQAETETRRRQILVPLEEVAELRAQLAAANAQRDELLRIVKLWREWGGHEPTCYFVRARDANPLIPLHLLVGYCDCGWDAAGVAIARAQSGQPAQRDDDGTASGGGAQ
jgi:hypothetical protein